jgi:N4-(beta-N-acetylglucosaminyl)-L-asparaginase
MQTRRSFLASGVVAGLSAGSLSKSLSAVQPRGKAGFPCVLATWKNRKAVEAAWEVLQMGGSALDAVEAGARVPEADPDDSSVGYGGLPDREGKVTLDACIMDSQGNAGSVVFLEGIKHAVSVARRVMENTPHVILAGEGALQFALQQGFKQEELLTPSAREAWERWKVESRYQPVINQERHDTIGILAMDRDGVVAGACSTSGLAFKMRGRVGDSPIVGAGLYVDGEVGAATATGLGEAVLKKMGAFSIVEMMRQGMGPQKACLEAVRRLLSVRAAEAFQVGYVAVDRRGRTGACSLRPGFQASRMWTSGFELQDAPSLLSR